MVQSYNEAGVAADKVKRLSRLEIPGGGQVVVNGNYAYIGHMDPPIGTSIIDVSDPRAPRVVSQITLPDAFSHSHKVRVIGNDIMFVNNEQQNRHFLRLGEKIPDIKARLEASMDRAPSDEEIAEELGVLASDIGQLTEAQRRGYQDGGFKIYDISHKSNPRQIAFQKTYGFGVHRFDVDENYAYISTEAEGYIGNILVVYNIKKPEQPEEICRWWMPGQHLAGGEVPTWEGYTHRLHHTLRDGNKLWAACWFAGFRVIDVADITSPKTIAAYDYHPPFTAATHTAIHVPFPLAGRDIAVIVDEEHRHPIGQLPAFMWVFDVGNLNDPKPLSTFHVSEADSPFSRTPEARFGAHQCQEHISNSLIYLAWFSGGLRIVDIADPLHPVEAGFFIPEPGQGAKAPQSNDVDVDERGLIYLLDRVSGLDILEFEIN